MVWEQQETCWATGGVARVLGDASVFISKQFDFFLFVYPIFSIYRVSINSRLFIYRCDFVYEASSSYI